jgi:hypothetical protein
MTSHEFARYLLSKEDLPLMVYDDEWCDLYELIHVVEVNQPGIKHCWVVVQFGTEDLGGLQVMEDAEEIK